MIIALFFISVMKEPKHCRRIKNFWRHQKESMSFVLKDRDIRWLTLYYGIIFSFSLMGIATFFQLYLRHVGVPLAHFSVIYPSIIISGALVSAKAHRIEDYLGERLTLALLPALLGVAFILMSLVHLYWGFLLLFIVQFIYCFTSPIMDHYAHIRIKSKHRATVLSIRNLAAALAFAAFGPVIGQIADHVSIPASLLAAGLIVVAAGIILMSSRPQNHRQH